jgi:uncharacterized membrane protein
MKNHLAAVGVGIFFGGVLGLLLHNLLIGICIGTALGAASERRHRNSN